RQYHQYLIDTHEVFSEGRMGLRSAAYLHNFMYDPEHELYSDRHANLLAFSRLFAGDQADDLAQWLHDQLSGGGGILLLEDVIHGKYKPNKRLLEHTSKMI